MYGRDADPSHNEDRALTLAAATGSSPAGLLSGGWDPSTAQPYTHVRWQVNTHPSPPTIRSSPRASFGPCCRPLHFPPHPAASTTVKHRLRLHRHPHETSSRPTAVPPAERPPPLGLPTVGFSFLRECFGAPLHLTFDMILVCMYASVSVL